MFDGTNLTLSSDADQSTSRFIANCSSCTTTELLILLTSCTNAIKNMLLNIVTSL